MFRNYFITAVRNLFRHRIYSFINIAGLTLGLTCAMLIILYVKDEASYDRFHKNIDHTYVIGRKELNPDGSILGSDAYTGYLQGPVFKSSIPEVSAFVRMEYSSKNIRNKNEILTLPVYFVDSNFFSAFSFPLLSGNPRTALLESNAIVISEDLAVKQFGTTDAIGKTILMSEGDAMVPYMVNAVARNCPQNSSIKFQALLPLKVSRSVEIDKEAWMNSLLNTFMILKPGADVKLVEAKMNKIYKASARESIRMMEEKYGGHFESVFSLQPFAGLHLNTDYRAYELSDASNPVFSYILSGIAFFILLIACINFINLTIARSVKRSKEIGIRKVVGGGRKQLIAQFLGESFILCFAAFVLAIVLVQVMLPLFNRLSGKTLSLSYLSDIKLIAGYMALFIITGLLAGFYPALVLSGYNPVQTLYNRSASGRKNYLQKSLVVLQFALASFLVVATFTVFQQFNYLVNKKLGYDDSNLLVLNQWGISPEQVGLFKQLLLRNPSIRGVAARNAGYYNTHAKVNTDTKVPIVVETIDESYIPVLKIPLSQGRNFSKEFPSDPDHAVLINETFAREAGWKDPLGKQVAIWGDEGKKYTVAGVVKDHYFQPLSESIKAQIFSLTLGRGFGNLYIKLQPGTESKSLPFIENTFKRIFPLSPFSFYFKHDENLANYRSEAKWKQILLFGALMTIFISCIGLFGLSVLSAEKRIKEIGIRRVLGASVGSVVTSLSLDFIKLVMLAMLVAIPPTWIAIDKWLSNYPNRITVNWMMFAATGVLMTIIALATVSFQAIKAAIANPVKSLRTE